MFTDHDGSRKLWVTDAGREADRQNNRDIDPDKGGACGPAGSQAYAQARTETDRTADTPTDRRTHK